MSPVVSFAAFGRLAGKEGDASFVARVTNGEAGEDAPQEEKLTRSLPPVVAKEVPVTAEYGCVVGMRVCGDRGVVVGAQGKTHFGPECAE